MSLRRLVVPALVVPAVLAAAGPASAAGGLAPGGMQTISIQLPGSWARQADRLGVSVVDLVQSENECLPPEVASGDTTCDPARGDLAGQLVAEVAAGELGGSGDCRETGEFVALDLIHPESQALLSVAGARCLAIRLTFPDGEGNNVAQSDAISFGVRTLAEGPDGVTPGSSAGSGSNGNAPGSSNGAAAAAGNGGRGATAQQNGNAGTGGAGGAAQAGTGTTGTAGVGTGGPATVLGEQTTPVTVGGNGVAVQTESSSTSLGSLVLAWGSVLVLVLGLALFLWWSRRRRREGAS